MTTHPEDCDAAIAALEYELAIFRGALLGAHAALAAWLDDEEDSPDSNQGLMDAFDAISAALDICPSKRIPTEVSGGDGQ